MIDIDVIYMEMALKEARQALEEDEIPIGAVVVCGDTVVGRGHNMTERLGDVTAHAEMMAITSAAQTLGGKYLQECTLYVTVEPCLMCAGAMGWAQVKRIVYGAGDSRRGYTTFTENPFHPKSIVKRGVLEEECSALMKEFFSRRR